MHQQPPQTPLFASTSPAKSSQVSALSERVVYLDCPADLDMNPSSAAGVPELAVQQLNHVRRPVGDDRLHAELEAELEVLVGVDHPDVDVASALEEVLPQL